MRTFKELHLVSYCRGRPCVTRSDQRRGRTSGANKIGTTPSLRSYNHSLKLLNDDESEAFRLNVLAAQQGVHDAVLAMGWFYLNGVGVEKDENAAVNWYTKSARQGDERAMFSLGQIAYDQGDYSEALLWFKRAADKGHDRSLFWIGKLHWRGEGVEENRQIAHRYFARAAENKVKVAQRTVRFLSRR
jgi:TPR repeat protein